MTRDDAGLLLRYIASRDGRKVDDAIAAAWFDDLGDIGYEDARAAVGEHYRTSEDKIMPAHIRYRVRATKLQQQPDGRGSHCGRAGCECSHTDGCEAGWIENRPGMVQADLFDAPEDAQPAARVQYDSVRPCPRCAPRRAELIEETADRRRAQQRLRVRTER